TRSILKDLLRDPPKVIGPVYATVDRPGYRYARGFTSRFLDCPVGLLQDNPVELQQGDAFLGLDFHYVIPTQVDFFSDMRRKGVKMAIGTWLGTLTRRPSRPRRTCFQADLS